MLLIIGVGPFTALRGEDAEPSTGADQLSGLPGSAALEASRTKLEFDAFSAARWYRLCRGLPEAATNMGWVRSNIRAGSSCALLALAVQFALSFGHIHRAEFPRASEFSQLTAGGIGAVSATGSFVSATAAQPIGGASDYCAICAVIVLANSVRPAAAPASAMSAGSVAVRFWAQVDAFASTSPHRLFQARAPPLI